MGAVRTEEIWGDIWLVLKRIDIEETCWTGGASGFLTILSDIALSLEHANSKPSLETLTCIYSEEHIYSIDEHLILLGLQWIDLRLRGVVGRAKIRDEIRACFEVPFTSLPPSTVPEPSAVREAREPTPKLEGESAVVSAVADAEPRAPVVPISQDVDAMLIRCSQRAGQIARGYPTIVKMDGVHGIERYLHFKHEVQCIIRGSVYDPCSFVGVELLLQFVTGPALAHCREVIAAEQLYSGRGDVALGTLWEQLDSRFDTPESNRFIVNLMDNCRQQKLESSASYVARFKALLGLQKRSLPDCELIVKFSNGIYCGPQSLSQLSRGLADAQGALDFEKYIITFLNIEKSVSSFNSILNYPPVRSNAMAVTDGSEFCFRCGEEDHLIKDCKRRVKYPCRECGGVDHYTKACRAGPPQGNRAGPPEPRPGPYQNRGKGRGKGVPFNDKWKGPKATPDHPPPTLQTLAECDSDEAVGNRVIRVSACSIGGHQLIDYTPPMVNLVCANGFEISGLHDTGASASFMHLDFAKELRRRGIVRKPQLHSVETFKVEYGNGQFEEIDTYVDFEVRLPRSRPCRISVFVSQQCSPAFILGRPALRSLELGMVGSVSSVSISESPSVESVSVRKAVSSVSISESPSVESVSVRKAVSSVSISESPSVESVSVRKAVSSVSISESPSVECVSVRKAVSAAPVCESPSAESVPVHEAFHPETGRTPLIEVRNQRLFVRFPLLENAFIAPFRSPRRNRSITDTSIIQQRLQEMQLEGKLEECSAREAHLVNEVVLVDKQSGTGGPRRFPSEDISKRYRVTLDLRVVNDLQVVNFGSCMGLVPNALAGSQARKSEILGQSQISGIDLLAQLPFQSNPNGSTYYIKIDLRDAFSSIFLPDTLRGLFCYELRSAPSSRFYRWKVLPQGWRWSPLLFATGVRYVLDQCVFDSSSTVVRNYQDDVLAICIGSDTARQVMRTLVDKFHSFGFEINPDKCTIARSVVFCGYEISEAGIVPSTKCKLTPLLIENSWVEYLNSKSVDGLVTSVKKWCGLFNYFRDFLPPGQRLCLSYLYTLTRNDCPLEKFTDEQTRTSYFSLANFVSGDLGKFPCGVVENTLATLVICDANQDGYSGILYRLVRSERDVVAPSEITEFLTSIRAQMSDILGDVKEDRLMLVPVKFCGNSFDSSVRKQSSTYRERVAQLFCVEAFRGFLYGPIVIITDNRNCGRNWHSIDEMFSFGGTLNLWLNFVACVQKIIWVSRNSPLLSLVDHLARLLSVRSPIAQQTTPTVTPPTPAVNLKVMEVVATDIPDSPDGATMGVGNEFSPNRFPKPTPSLAMEIKEGYLTDSETKYQGILLKDIYLHLQHDNSESQAVKNLSRRFFLHDGILYHCRVVGSPQICVPRCPASIRAKIIRVFHDSLIGLHGGYSKTFEKVSLNYFWVGMARDILTYVKSCSICFEARIRAEKYRGDLSSISREATRPFAGWVIDHCGPFRADAGGPFTNSPTGTTYVLVCLCVYSAYCVLIEVPDVTAAVTVAAIVDRIIGSFGFFERIYCDRSTSFNNQLLQTLAEQFQFSLQFSASYTPRVQGRAERMVRSLKSIVECAKIEGTDAPLHRLLPWIQLTHNSTAVGNTSCTPLQVCYGSNLCVDPLSTSEGVGITGDVVGDLHTIQSAWERWRGRSLDQACDYYAKKSTTTTWNIDDLVYRVFAVQGFERRRVTGPHRVISKKSDSQIHVEGYSYPIPAYQLFALPDRPLDLQTGDGTEQERGPEPSSASPIARPIADLVPGDLLIYEVCEDNGVALDVAAVRSLPSFGERLLQVQCYWYNSSPRRRSWHVWDGKYEMISYDQIRATGFRLTQNSRVPAKLLSYLSSSN